jgi:hypothetical protein
MLSSRLSDTKGISHYINTSLVQKFKELSIVDATRLSGRCFPVPPALNHSRRGKAGVTLPFSVQEPHLFHYQTGIADQPPPDDSSIYLRDNVFPSIINSPFSYSHNPEAEPAEPERVSTVGSLLPTEEHISSSQTDHEDLLSKAEAALQRQVAYKTNKLYTEQGPVSSKAFLSALCTLPTESFDPLWAGVLNNTSTLNPNTPRIVDEPSTLTNVSHRGIIGTTGDKTQIWKAKLDRFIANAVGALIQLVDRHWELLTAGLDIREFRGDPSCRDKHTRRLHHHLELRKLRIDTQLHWLRRGLALIRNLRDFEEYLEENGHPRSEGLNQRLRQAYRDWWKL